METSITGLYDSKATAHHLPTETGIINVREIGVCVRQKSVISIFFPFLFPRRKSSLSPMSDCDIIEFWGISFGNCP